ncbi:MAG: SDR family oxidoreductase [Candidatus Hydrogenedentes bacterium]|nr:SDR family oxidoreductase [Candidatus Hydrogenedentota bacterium]
MEQLAGKTALVTGAAHRIGRAISTALAEAGANVVIHYRSSGEDADRLASDLAELGAKAWSVQGDLGDPEQASALISSAHRVAGALDIVVNNASIFPESTLRDFTRTQLQESVDVNALGPFLIARSFYETGGQGVVINLLDCMIADYDRKHVAYHLSKQMLFSLTRMMAVEFAPAVRVNGVAPGLVLPPAGKDESYLAGLASSNPLNAYGNVDDVAEAVLFLARSTFVTGQVIYVDGGRNLRGAMYG